MWEREEQREREEEERETVRQRESVKVRIRKSESDNQHRHPAPTICPAVLRVETNAMAIAKLMRRSRRSLAHPERTRKGKQDRQTDRQR